MATSPFKAEDQQLQCLTFRTSATYTLIEQDPDIRMVLGVICDGPIAFGALGRLLPHLSEMRLRRSLQHLEEAGVILVVNMRSHPARMAYLLTASAEACKPVLRAVALPSLVPGREASGHPQRRAP